MNKVFPNYQMNKLPDGRICWIGEANCLQNKYTLVVVYETNYPAWNINERPLRVYVYCVRNRPVLRSKSATIRYQHPLSD